MSDENLTPNERYLLKKLTAVEAINEVLNEDLQRAENTIEKLNNKLESQSKKYL